MPSSFDWNAAFPCEGESRRRRHIEPKAEFKITSSLRRIFVLLLIKTASRNTACSVSVADQSYRMYILCSFRGGSASLVGLKRRHNTQSEAGNAKKRVTHDTFMKWKRDLDRECQTVFEVVALV